MFKFAKVALFQIVWVAAAQSQAQGLTDFYQQALLHNPDYRIAEYERLASEELYKQARSSMLPQASLTYVDTHSRQDIVSSDNAVFGSGRTNFPAKDLTVSVSQSLFNYEAMMKIKQSKFQIAMIDADFQAARQDLILNVADAYFAVVALLADKKAVDAEEASVAQHYELVQAKQQGGLVRDLDVMDARARYYQVQARRVEIEASLQDALQAMRQLGGHLPDSIRTIAGNMPLVSPDPVSVEDWLDTAYQYNPEIEAANKAVEAADMEIRVQRGGHMPTLDFFIDYNDNETSGTLFGGGSHVKTRQVGLQVSLPIFSGGVVSSRVRESASRRSQALLRQEQARRSVHRDVQASYRNILSDKARVEALEISEASNASVVESRNTAFSSGLVTGLAVLDAERDLFLASTDLSRARISFLINSLRLKRSVGLLSLEDLIEIDSLLQAEGISVESYL